jgi:hypothetical protein
MTSNPLQAIRLRQASNRAEFARKQKDRQESEAAQQQFKGRYLGFDADQGAALVEINNGGIVPCQPITSGTIKPNQQVVVTVPRGASKGFVDAMPR